MIIHLLSCTKRTAVCSKMRPEIFEIGSADSNAARGGMSCHLGLETGHEGLL